MIAITRTTNPKKIFFLFKLTPPPGEKNLYLIEAIPDEVIEQGPQTTAEWLSAYTGDMYITDGDKFYNTSKVETLGGIGCISAVGLAIAENLFSFIIPKRESASLASNEFKYSKH